MEGKRSITFVAPTSRTSASATSTLIDFAILVFGDTSWSNPVTQGWVLFVVFWLAAAYSRLVDVPFSRLLRGATAGWEHRGEAKLQESKV